MSDDLPLLPITVDPDILGGVPVFRGTRVPVQTLFDYIAEGNTLGEFLNNFPTVEHADVQALLKSLEPFLIAKLSP